MSNYWIAMQIYFAKKWVKNLLGWIACLIIFGGIGVLLAWRG
jgi:hypothetical protein